MITEFQVLLPFHKHALKLNRRKRSSEGHGLIKKQPVIYGFLSKKMNMQRLMTGPVNFRNGRVVIRATYGVFYAYKLYIEQTKY